MFPSAHKFCLAILLLSYSSAQAYTDLFFFGDSLSDVGNLDGATIGVFPGGDYYEGRFSNGPVYSELLYQQLGFGTLTPSRDGGNNYAYGGAQTSGTSGFTGLFLNDLDEQVDYFLSDNVTDPTALHIVLIGANDLLGDRTNMASLAGTVAQQITRLYNDGARDFLVMNLPKLGLTPRYNSGTSAATMTARTIDYNTQLALAMDNLEVTLPGVELQQFDLSGLFDDVVQHPATYGLTNVTQSAAVNLTSGGSADNFVASPDEYLFWDDVHPTRVVHANLAETLANVILSDSQPGDFNGDGLVDLADYSVWRNHLGVADESAIHNAGNGFAGVDVGDYQLWRQHFGEGTLVLASPTVAVSEPSTLLLTLCGLLITLGRFAASNN